MKILIITILLQISFGLKSINCLVERDNLIVTYSTSFKKYKSRPNLTKTSVKLYISDTTSVFICDDLESIFKVDALDFEGLTANQVKKAKDRISAIEYFTQKFHNKGYLTLNQEIAKKTLVGYKENLMLPEIWQIYQDTATISGLKAFRAECKYGGREWTAWFSPEIPVSDGPSKFSGLPGLIVKLESADGDYQFILEGLERSKGQILKLPKYQIVEKEKFQDLRLAFYDNLIPENSQINMNIGGKILNREETIQHLKKGELDKNLLEIE